jgi:hypothetical protein
MHPPRFSPLLTFALSCFALAPVTHAAPLWNGPPLYGDAPDATHPWAVHDRNRPQPKRVEPGTPSTQAQPGKPPSDAVILFDGTAASLAKWESDTKPGEPSSPTKWIVRDGALECVPKSGYIRTKEEFGDCQLHVEWAAPTNVQGDSQGRGNSGIFLMGLVEVQVLDAYNNPTYADGTANAFYGVNPPLANVLRPPGEYQSVDIIFRRPVYDGDKVLDPGYVTVFCNGVLVQDHTPIEGPGGHLRRTSARAFPAKGPLKLQDHGNPVRFRNIWYRPLPPRAVEGGTDGALSPAATLAKRKEIAASIRADAPTMKSDAYGYMVRLAESLVYEQDDATAKEFERAATSYVSGLKALSGGSLEQKKNEAIATGRHFAYLTRFKIVPATFAPKTTLEAFLKAQGWDEESQKKQKKKAG